MSKHKTILGLDFASPYKLRPWQEEILAQISNGGRLVILKGRHFGWTAIYRELEKQRKKHNQGLKNP